MKNREVRTELTHSAAKSEIEPLAPEAAGVIENAGGISAYLWNQISPLRVRSLKVPLLAIR